MTTLDERTMAAQVIAKAEHDDQGTAMLLTQFALYEALCDEADRIRPMAERRAAQEILKRTEGAFETLAKRYATGDAKTQAEAAEIADELLELRKAAEVILSSPVSKDEPWYGDQPGERDPATGRFQRTGVRGAVLDMLGIGTRQGRGGDSKPAQARSTLDSIVGEDADTYSRLRTIGQGLVRSTSPQTQRAGSAARIVSDIGPEAQRALEPGIRRTAYRYRGTERRPNMEAQKRTRALANSIQSGSDTMSHDQLKLAIMGDVGAQMLWRQIPDVETARISLEAGKMPPSVGLMFDADGHLVSEAMGYNGDHYLPFDLKNLKRLKGGQYVRTRTTGGPTDEDIYTALMTGTRQIQVISNSGNFVIEFDPDLRGGRRYSDKARQMVDRYARLVSAIGSGKLMQTDLDPEQIRQIRRDAWEQAGGDEAMARQLSDEAVRTARMEARFSEPDEDALMKEAHTQTLAEYKNQPSVSSKQILTRRNEIFREKVKQHQEGQSRAYRLDGEGYKAAMKALKTEFPYFIRDARYEPLDKFLVRTKSIAPDEPLPTRGGSDMGYTRRGELATYRQQDGAKRPKAERTGRKGLSAAPSVDEDDRTVVTERTESGGGDGARTVQRPTVDGLRLPEPDAPDFAALAERNAGEVKLGLQTSLGVAFAMAGDIENALPAVPMINDKAIAPDDPELFGPNVSGADYGAWLLDHSEQDAKKAAAFLAKPENSKHRKRAKEAIAHLIGLSGRVPAEFKEAYNAQTLGRASGALDMVDGAGAIFSEEEPNILAPPGDKPLAMPEVLALKASAKNLEAYARAHPKIAAIAAQLQEAQDPAEAARALIEAPAAQARKLLKWHEAGLGAGDKPQGVTAHPSEARHMAQAGDKHPVIAGIRDAQIAWALVKAEEAVRTLKDTEPLRFADVGPKAKAPEGAEGAAKRFSPAPRVRVVKVDRDSPLARAFAASRRR